MTLQQNNANEIRSQFDELIAQPSISEKILHVLEAKGCFLTMSDGKQYLDFISGVAVNNVGHSHPEVISAVNNQMQQYAHTMVYGEHIQTPQIECARLLTEKLPSELQTVYFLCTGSEATDLSLKIAYKETGRSEIVAFKGAYHGDTFGAMSVYGQTAHRSLWESQLPQTRFLNFGDFNDLEQITNNTAAVIIEPVQGEAGLIYPPDGYLSSVRQRCTETGTLLIFDEVQTGIGRLGHWFAVNKYNVVPDILNVGKALGGGLPLAAVITSHKLMSNFNHSPEFSHITTFGGNPVCCAAGIAAMRVIGNENLLENTQNANKEFHRALRKLKARYSEFIKDVRGDGLMIALELYEANQGRHVVHSCVSQGLLIETTLFNAAVVRISPPLTIQLEEIQKGISIIESAIQSLV